MVTKSELIKIVRGKIEKLLKEIGGIVVAFNSLEFSLDILIGNLMGLLDHRIEKRIISSLSFRQKISLSKSLLIEKEEPKIVERFEPLYKRLKEVNTERNKILHSIWLQGLAPVDEDVSISRLYFRDVCKNEKKYSFSRGLVRDVKPEDLTLFSKEIKELTIELGKFMAENIWKTEDKKTG